MPDMPILRILLTWAVALHGPSCTSSRQVDDSDTEGSTPIEVALEIADVDRAWVLASGETAVLLATVVQSDGSPAAGVEVIFCGPDRPGQASGTFAGSPDRPQYHQTHTDSDGRVTGMWTANDAAGVYYVDVLVVGSTAADAFAITQNRRLPEPAVSSDAATRTLRQVAVADPLSEGPQRLYGPVLLAAGDEVRSGIATRPEVEIPSWIAEGPTWMLWVDEDAFSNWSHTARVLLLNAEDSSAAPETLLMSMWPTLRPAGQSEFVDLASPAHVNQHMDDIAAAWNDVGVTPEVGILQLAQGEGDDRTCAIILFGPEESHFRSDAKKMYDFFKHELKVRVLTPDPKPSDGPEPGAPTQQDVHDYLEQAATCDEVYVFVTGHGFYPYQGAGVELGAEGSSDDGEPYDFDDMGRDFGDHLEGKSVRLIIDACFSGAAISQFQYRGFVGTIVVASSESQASKYDPVKGGWFTYYFLDMWREELAEEPRPRLEDVYAKFVSGGSSMTYQSYFWKKAIMVGAQVVDIRDTAISWALPQVELMKGEKKEVRIDPPQGFKGPMNPTAAKDSDINPAYAGKESLVGTRLEVQDGSVATVTPTKIQLSSQQGNLVTFHGLKVDTTTYSSVIRGGGMAFEGSATIVVHEVPAPECFENGFCPNYTAEVLGWGRTDKSDHTLTTDVAEDGTVVGVSEFWGESSATKVFTWTRDKGLKMVPTTEVEDGVLEVAHGDPKISSQSGSVVGFFPTMCAYPDCPSVYHRYSLLTGELSRFGDPEPRVDGQTCSIASFAAISIDGWAYGRVDCGIPGFTAVGWASTWDGSSGENTYLAPELGLADLTSDVFGANEGGVGVGWAQLPDHEPDYMAVTFKDGSAEQLPMPGDISDYTLVRAVDVNNRGDAVGWGTKKSSATNPVAMAWLGGTEPLLFEDAPVKYLVAITDGGIMLGGTEYVDHRGHTQVGGEIYIGYVNESKAVEWLKVPGEKKFFDYQDIKMSVHLAADINNKGQIAATAWYYPDDLSAGCQSWYWTQCQDVAVVLEP